jgi:hypothetical protein
LSHGHSGESFAPEERERLIERVQVVEERIIRYREVPVQTPATIRLLVGEMERLSAGWPSFAEVLDLSASERPDAATRAELKRQIAKLAPRMRICAVVVKNNVVMRAMARFFGATMGLKISLHETEQEAMEAARRALLQ